MQTAGQARRMFKNAIAHANNPLDCIDQADGCIIVTEWNQFKTMTTQTFLEKMQSPIVIDGRRIYDPNAFLKRGVQLGAIGFGPKARRYQLFPISRTPQTRD